MKALHVRVFCNFSILGFPQLNGDWSDAVFIPEECLLIWSRANFIFPEESDWEEMYHADSSGKIRPPQIIAEIEVPDDLPKLTRAVFDAENALGAQVEQILRRDAN